MTILDLFRGANLALVLSVVTGTVIPFLAALATRAPKFLTGVITLFLAAASGFLSAWAAGGADYDWRAGLGTALATWVVAVITHSKILKGTAVEASLHAFPSATTAPPAPATVPVT